MDLCNQSTVRRILDEHGLAPKKSFGQNFLINPAVPEDIADASAYEPFFYRENEGGACALEIGPGVGALTRELAARYPSVTAVEIDDGLIPVLADTLADCENTRVVHQDFMETDVPALLKEQFGDSPVHVCGNLPYYITTPILMKLLEAYPADGASPIRRITLMVQSEVADRICAKAGSPDCGAITAAVALRGRAKKLFTVSAGNFYPVPKVSSAVLTIETYPHGLSDLYPDAPTGEAFAPYFAKITAVIEAAFGQRRKTLTNALGSLYPKSAIEEALSALDIRTDIRGEKLSALDFCRLTTELERIR
ncbi:MAG: ribosomal RNA small subunit methyltransferase A [Clostridia bacterium]|nr:ribosomal RNA small subunit methyltransferase A [Clostridia bacterium]